jgi:hypothetical protein
MRQALEALERVALHLMRPQDVKVMQALRAALEQPEQEAVAWRWSESDGKRWFGWRSDWTHYEKAKSMAFPIEYAYPTPPQRKPLTDEQGRPMTYWGGKAQSKQAEPVTHLHEWFSTGAMGPGEMRCIHCGVWGNDASLTTPPAAQRQWSSLTDDEIKEIIGPWGDTPIKGYTRELIDKIDEALRSKNT